MFDKDAKEKRGKKEFSTNGDGKMGCPPIEECNSPVYTLHKN